jgi:type II secretion system protein L
MIEDLEEALIELGFNVISIIPDVLTLPTNMSENDKSIISLLNIKNEWLVRVGKYKGYVLNKDILDFGLQQIQKDLNEDVKVLSLSPLPEDLSATYEEELSESVYALMAEGALSSSVNFSTQSLVSSSKLFNKELFKGWIKVIIVLVVTFVIWFVNVYLDINKVNKEISTYKSSQRQLMTSIFGSKLDVNNMLEDFNNRLDFIESVDLHNSFLNVSRALHSRIIRENGIMIKSFSYDNETQDFEIEFEVPQDYKVDSLKAQLIDMFTVEQVKSSNKDKITVYVWRIRKIADE